MKTTVETSMDLRMEIAQLAMDMVRLEEWAREAYQRRNWIRVGELHEQREQTQRYRSDLLRELWLLQGKGKRRRQWLDD